MTEAQYNELRNLIAEGWTSQRIAQCYRIRLSDVVIVRHSTSYKNFLAALERMPVRVA
jgi:hypothetical protein